LDSDKIIFDIHSYKFYIKYFFFKGNEHFLGLVGGVGGLGMIFLDDFKPKKH